MLKRFINQIKIKWTCSMCKNVFYSDEFATSWSNGNCTAKCPKCKNNAFQGIGEGVVAE